MRGLPIVLPRRGALARFGRAGAEVTRVEIARRADLGMSGYEKIVGTIHFAVDPKDPHNRLVADLDKAPVNAAGRVEFSSDLYILGRRRRAETAPPSSTSSTAATRWC